MRADRYSEAQMRTVMAALDLFPDHGVSGTSLQMIADRVGVTKAAIYHQFKSKDSIVLGAVEVVLSRLEAALDIADHEPTPGRARAVLLAQVIDLAVERRRWASALQSDPVMFRLISTHEPFLDLMHRVFALLLDQDSEPATLMRTAMVSAAIGGAIAHPLVATLDDETLRFELWHVTRRLFEIPD